MISDHVVLEVSGPRRYAVIVTMQATSISAIVSQCRRARERRLLSAMGPTALIMVSATCRRSTPCRLMALEAPCAPRRRPADWSRLRRASPKVGLIDCREEHLPAFGCAGVRSSQPCSGGGQGDEQGRAGDEHGRQRGHGGGKRAVVAGAASRSAMHAYWTRDGGTPAGEDGGSIQRPASSRPTPHVSASIDPARRRYPTSGVRPAARQIMRRRTRRRAHTRPPMHRGCGLCDEVCAGITDVGGGTAGPAGAPTSYGHHGTIPILEC